MPGFSDPDQNVVLQDNDGNLVGVVLDGAIYRLQVESRVVQDGVGNVIRIEDGGGSGVQANVDAAGRLVTSANIPLNPPGTTPVHVSEQSDVATTIDHEFLIPTGETLTMTRFQCGAEGSSAQKVSKVELFHDPAGDGTGMTLIRVGYHSNNNGEFALSEQFTGDGTAKIRMRRERMDGGTYEIAGAWDGYY